MLTAVVAIDRDRPWSGQVGLHGLQVSLTDPPVAALVDAAAGFEADWAAVDGPRVRISIDRIDGMVNDQALSGSGVLSARGVAVEGGSATLSLGGNTLQLEALCATTCSSRGG